MKLGLCYMLFDGEELLEFAIKGIRNQIDHLSVTYQTTSYFGNPSGPDLLPLLERLKSDRLIDELIYFEPNLKIHYKENELKLRNIGLQASRKAGCTHHISSDVDEFYDPNQLEYAKKVIEDYDSSIAPSMTYYKDPTFLVHPCLNIKIPFIHSVDKEYNKDIAFSEFPFYVEKTRKLINCKKYKIFTNDEFVIHHMSYVRKNILKKFQNSESGKSYKIDKFIKNFDSYKLGERVCLLPDYVNRRTIKVENKFGISI